MKLKDCKNKTDIILQTYSIEDKIKEQVRTSISVYCNSQLDDASWFELHIRQHDIKTKTKIL